MKTEPTIYNSASRVKEVIQGMIDSDVSARDNRALIDACADGAPPFTEEEALDLNLSCNVNFQEFGALMHKVRNTFRNAFLKPGNFFTVNITGNGERDERSESSKIITREINRIMKASLPYIETLKAQFANAGMHGIAPALWKDRNGWCPRAVAIDDVLIPKKTYLDLSNLTYFAVYREYTAYEFHEMTKNGGAGWNMEMCRRILAQLILKTITGDIEDTTHYHTYKNPERVQEELKEGGGFWDSDAVPVVKVWFFYAQDCENGEGWYRMIVPCDMNDTVDGESIDDFIFKDENVYASDHTEIIHFQFGNVSNKAPFRVHGIRSVGFLVYSLAQLMNRLRCRHMDAIYENMMWYFRMSDPADRDRIQRIDLHNMGIIPEGIDIVTRDQRHTPDLNLVNSGLMQLKGLMGEMSEGYSSSMPQSGGTPMSASEVNAQMSQMNQMLIAILGSAYDYARFQYREICRRFLNKSSTDKDVRLFRKRVLDAGVPESYLDIELWDVDPVRVLGGGQKIIEQQQAQLLMNVRPLLDPNSQRKALHLYVEANTDDPALADEMVPIDDTQYPSESVIEGQQTAAVLLQGLPVGIVQGVNRNEYIAGMIQTLTVKVQQVNQQDGTPDTANELRGMMNLSTHIKENIQILEQDKGQGQLTQAYKSMVARADNMIRAFGQRLAEKMQAQQAAQGQDPKVMADIQATMAKERVKAQTKAASAAQSREQKQQAFVAEEQRKQQEHSLEMQRKQQENQIDLSAKALAAATDAGVARNLPPAL